MVNKIKHKLISAGRFLRLIDDQYVCLSITNIAVIVVLVKIALEPQPSITEMGSLLITLSLYYGKKHLVKNEKVVSDAQTQVIDELKQKVKDVNDKIGSVSAMVGIKNLK